MILDAFLIATLGLPWQRDGLHCWALTRRVQAEIFGRALPAGLTAVPDNRLALAKLFRAGVDHVPGWQEVSAPQHGAVALMHRQGAPATALIHSGCYLAIDTGGVLHTDDPHGVVFDDLMSLRARNWVPRWFIPKA